MKNIIIAIIAILLLCVLVLGYEFYKQMNRFPEDNLQRDLIGLEDKKIIENESEGELIGGDEDEYGCLIDAGYGWCEEKQKCLRNWEEECTESSEEGIAKALAVAHGKDVSEVSVKITQESGDYARGGVEFAPGGMGNGGLFLAVRIDSRWKLVYDGNGNPDCEALENEYNFPTEMLKNFCY